MPLSFQKRYTTRQPNFNLPFSYCCFIKESENVQGLTIFNNQFLYTAHTNTTFFLSNENSVTEIYNYINK